jgi:hypothetical protein
MVKFPWGLAGKVTNDPGSHDTPTVVAPAVTLVLLPTDGTAFDPPKWIIGDKAGAATVTDSSGNALAGFPITGEEQHVALTAIASLSTTTKVWGGY